MKTKFGVCLHLSLMLCGYCLSFCVFSVCLGFPFLPPPCSSIRLPCCRRLALPAPVSTSFCWLGFFLSGWSPLCSFFLTFLWLFHLGVWSLLSLSLLFLSFLWLLWVSLFWLGRISSSLRVGVLPLGRVSSCLASLHSSFACLSPTCRSFSMSASSYFYTAPFPVCGPSWVILIILGVFLPPPSCCKSPSWVRCQCRFAICCFPRGALPSVPSCSLFCFRSFLRFLVGLLLLLVALFLLPCRSWRWLSWGVSLPIGLLHFRFGSSLFVTSSSPVGVPFRASSVSFSSWPL